MELCDTGCPAKATVKVSRGGFQLTFCGHHFTRYEANLLTGGWNIVGEVKHHSVKVPVQAKGE